MWPFNRNPRPTGNNNDPYSARVANAQIAQERGLLSQKNSVVMLTFVYVLAAVVVVIANRMLSGIGQGDLVTWIVTVWLLASLLLWFFANGTINRLYPDSTWIETRDLNRSRFLYSMGAGTMLILVFLFWLNILAGQVGWLVFLAGLGVFSFLIGALTLNSVPMINITNPLPTGNTGANTNNTNTNNQGGLNVP